MEPKRNLKSEDLPDKEKERIRLTQDILHCDDMIYKLNGDPFFTPEWVRRKEDLEFQLDQLNDDEL